MKIRWYPIDEIIPYKGDRRKIPQSVVKTIAASLQRFGWKEPIVVEPPFQKSLKRMPRSRPTKNPIRRRKKERN